MTNLDTGSRQTLRGKCLVCTLMLLILGQDTNTVYSFAPSAINSVRSGMATLAAFKKHVDENVDVIQAQNKEGNRRSFMSSFLSTTVVATLSTVVAPQPSLAAKRYVLDDETGEYIEQDDERNWQVEWKSRYDQMSTMTTDEIFQAARGAGNVDLKDLENESPASRKRRAFNGCRDKPTREKLGNIEEKSCTKRVLEGDVDFVLNVL
eukprot:CAMPEP_0172367064 /NCGR_PEP_ID=MMETSP1060-20121228/18739_1 /TAXON_ID=37318 /ORGANISM="Pseudo-nitzschia pungens, Strain cf. cingulata" /LENGTH=206 /DNA_ID=CAMNT_0013091145 /DNA_START=102 /DNA_END=722 /DNA_ORIENTATION=-